MDITTMVAVIIALISGVALILTCIVGYMKNRTVPSVLLLSGVALIALPSAASIKLGPTGIEVQNRDQLALVNAQLADVTRAPSRISSSDNFLAENKNAKHGDAARTRSQQPASDDFLPPKKHAVLIFFSDTAAATADKIVDQLRDSGFLASGTATDFFELGLKRFSYSSGDSYIRYSARYREDAIKIQTILNDAGITKVELIESERLSAGALQIGLF